MTGNLLSVRDVAERAGKSEETVRRWFQRSALLYGDRKLYGEKFGRDWFVTPGELERFMRAEQEHREKREEK